MYLDLGLDGTASLQRGRQRLWCKGDSKMALDCSDGRFRHIPPSSCDQTWTGLRPDFDLIVVG